MCHSTLCNSYTMGCPPVRGDNPRALASGLSYVQVENMVKLFYTTYISVHLAHHEIFCAKVGKGGIIRIALRVSTCIVHVQLAESRPEGQCLVSNK